MSAIAKGLCMKSENNCLTFGVGELLRWRPSLAGPNIRVSGGWVCNRLPDMQVRDGGGTERVE